MNIIRYNVVSKDALQIAWVLDRSRIWFPDALHEDCRLYSVDSIWLIEGKQTSIQKLEFKPSGKQQTAAQIGY